MQQMRTQLIHFLHAVVINALCDLKLAPQDHYSVKGDHWIIPTTLILCIQTNYHSHQFSKSNTKKEHKMQKWEKLENDVRLTSSVFVANCTNALCKGKGWPLKISEIYIFAVPGFLLSGPNMHSLEAIKKWLVIADFSPGPGEIYVPNLWHFKQAPHRNYIWEMPAHLGLISYFHSFSQLLHSFSWKVALSKCPERTRCEFKSWKQWGEFDFVHRLMFTFWGEN